MTVFNKRTRKTAVFLTTTFLLFTLGILSVHAQSGYSDVAIIAGAGLTNITKTGANPVTFSPSGDSAIIGADEIAAELDAGNAIIINTANAAGTQSGDITVATGVIKSVSNAANITLAADGTITIASSGSVTNIGSGAVTITANDLAINGTVAAAGSGGMTLRVLTGALTLDNGTVNGGTGGNLLLYADAMDWQNSAVVQGAGNLFLRNQTAGTTIGLGGGIGALNLDDSELGFIQSGFASVSIGNSNAGNVDIDTITLNDITVFNGASTSDQTGIDIASPSRITFQTVNINPGQSAPGILDVDLGAQELRLGSGRTINIELGGLLPGAGASRHDQINLIGGFRFAANDALNVSLYGGFAPLPGDEFVIVNNDGADAIIGAFVGLAEGATVSGGGYDFTISYVGGSGNDIVLTTSAYTTGYSDIAISADPTANITASGTNPVTYFPTADSANINVADINAVLDAGNGIAFDHARVGGTEAGNITISAALAKSAGADVNIAIQPYNRLFITGAGSVTNIGGGSLTITGNEIAVDGSIATANNGVLTLRALTGALTLDNGAVNGGTGGNLLLYADAMDWQNSAVVQGSGNLYLRNQTANTTIGLGGGVGDLNLDDTELGFIQPGFASVSIGNGNGNVDIDTITLTTIASINGASISDHTGVDISSSARVILQTVNINPGQSAPGILDVNFGAQELRIGNSRAINIELGGATAGTGAGFHDQINVAGGFRFASNDTLNLSLYGGFTPALGDQFVIINNDGADAIIGVFGGLAEGATVSADGYDYAISYAGGDGNDIVLTLLSGYSNVNISSAATSNIAVSGTGTAVDPYTFSPTGDSANITVADINAQLDAGNHVLITTTNAAGTEAGRIEIRANIVKSSGADADIALTAAENIIVQPSGSVTNIGGGGITLTADDSILVASTLHTVGSGDLTLSALTGSLSFSFGSVNGGSGGGVFLIADDMSWSDNTPVQGAGALTIRPQTTGTTIGLGNGAVGDLNLDAAELGFLQDGFSSIAIGASDAGVITVNTAAFLDPLTLLSASDITDGGAAGTDITATSASFDGNVSPGASPGTLTVSGDISFANNSSYSVELTGATTTGNHDQIDVTGAVAIGSNVTLTLDVTSYTTHEIGSSIVIVANDGADAVVGTFDGLAEGAMLLAGGYGFAISYVGGDGNDVVLTAAIPPTGHSNVVVNNSATGNMTVSGAGTFADPYTFTPTADSANVNTADIETQLNAGLYVAITTANPTGAQVGTIDVMSPISQTTGDTNDLNMYAADKLTVQANMELLGDGFQDVGINLIAGGGLQIDALIRVSGGNNNLQSNGTASGTYAGVYISGSGIVETLGNGITYVRGVGGPGGGEGFRLEGSLVSAVNTVFAIFADTVELVNAGGGDPIITNGGPGSISFAPQTAGISAGLGNGTGAWHLSQVEVNYLAPASVIQVGILGSFGTVNIDTVASDDAFQIRGDAITVTNFIVTDAVDTTNFRTLTGAILDGGVNGDLDISSPLLYLLSATDIGAAVNPIEISADTLQGRTINGTWYLNELDDLTITPPGLLAMTAGTDINITAGGHLTVSNNTAVTGNGNINLISGGSLRIDSGVTLSTDSGDLALTADRQDWQNGSALQGAGALYLRQLTAGTTIGLGGGAGDFNLDDTELSAIQSGFTAIEIGQSGAGNVDIDTIALPAPTTFYGASTSDHAGVDIAIPGNVTLRTDSFSPGQSAPGIFNVDVAGSGFLFGSSATSVNMELGGTSPGEGAGFHDQINVVGTVSIADNPLNLSLYGGFAPVVSDQFVIINNDGADVVAGTFAGLPEGATVWVDWYESTISYAGGDGDDVVLTVTAVPPPTIDPTLSWLTAPGSFPTGTVISPTGILTGANRFDIVFMFDESGSIGSGNFTNMKAYVLTKLNSDLPAAIAGDDVRVAVVKFYDTSTTVFTLDQHIGNVAGMNAAVSGMSYNGGSVDLEAALDYVDSNILTPANGDRADAANIVVLMSDFQVSFGVDEPGVLAATGNLRANGAYVNSIGVGFGVYETLAQDAATAGSGVYMELAAANGTDMAPFLGPIYEIEVELPDTTILTEAALDIDAGNTFTVPGQTLLTGANTFIARAYQLGNATAVTTDTLTLTGIAPDDLGNALAFDGTNDYVNIPAAVSLAPVTTLAVEAWAYMDSFVDYAGIAGNVYDTGSSESGYGLYTRAGDQIEFFVKTTTTPADGGWGRCLSGALNAGQWYHVAGVYDGAALRMYIDGAEVCNTAVTGNIVYAPANDMKIGAYVDNDEAHYFHGKIDDVRIWDSARNLSDIQNNRFSELNGNESGLAAYYKMEDGQGKGNTPVTALADQTANGNNGTLTGMGGLIEWNGRLWTADSIAASGGITMTDSGFLQDNGDDITFWFADTGNDNDLTDLPAGVEARWRRTWDCVVTDVNGNGGTVDITFDFDDALMGNGQPPAGAASNYVLLHRPNTGVPFSILVDGATGYNAARQTASFAGVNTSGLCSEIVIGTRNVTDSPTAVTVQSFAANPSTNIALLLTAVLLVSVTGLVVWRRRGRIIMNCE